MCGATRACALWWTRLKGMALKDDCGVGAIMPDAVNSSWGTAAALVRAHGITFVRADREYPLHWSGYIAILVIRHRKPMVAICGGDGLHDDLSCCGMECLTLSPVRAAWQVA